MLKISAAVIVCIALFTALYFVLQNDFLMGALFTLMAIIIYRDKDVK